MFMYWDIWPKEFKIDWYTAQNFTVISQIFEVVKLKDSNYKKNTCAYLNIHLFF